MKAMTTGMLNAGYLRELRRDNGVATIIAVCVTMTGLLWMVFRFGGNGITAFFAYWMYALAGFTGAFWTLRTVYRARRREVELAGSYQLAWLLIGLGLLVNGIAGISLVFLEIVGQTSLLWFAGILSDLYYPLIFAGLFFMHDGKPFRISMVIDALITTFCLLGICWFLIIGPAYQHVGPEKSIEYLLELAMTFSCPLGAVLLILAFALLIQRGIAPAVRLSFCLIGASLLAHIWAVSAYAYTSGIIHSYQAGTPYIDTFWLVSFLSLGLAVLYQYTGLASQADQERMQAQRSLQHPARPTLGYKRARVRGWRRIQNMLIYVPLVFVLGLMASGELLHDNWISDDLAALAAFIAMLMAVRHFFATRENDALLQEREKRHQESEHLRYIVTQLTDIVELEQLRERICSMMIGEFGFTAAMLLLEEEYSGAPALQAQLLVSTAAIATPPAKWRLHGESVLRQIVLSGKKAELVWSDHISELPVEVRPWLQKQHIELMLFYPLVYQGKILGSLGVARHALARERMFEISIVQIYAEQITPIIERAYLYREINGREAFARAMVNIASRLNAAVVEPAEISQLICEEGAKAVQADYVLLYRYSEKQLLPHAVANKQQDVTLALNDWPALFVAESEFAYELHPTILDVSRRQTIPLAQDIGESTLTTDSFFRLPPQQMLTLRAKLARHSIHTAILAPLVAGGHLIGLLVFARVIPSGTSGRRSFGEADLSPAQDFVEQARVAFANAQLYQHVQAAHEGLKELDQLKDQFMVTASHELRTPLTAVQGYIELMAQFEDVLPAQQRREFLRKAQRGCEELSVLLENVMDASRLEAEAEAEASIRSELIKRIGVREIVEKIIVMIEPQLEQEKREAQVDIPDYLFAYADPVRLRQVLMNISVNALKYSPARTPISYTARSVRQQDEHVIISITDKGRGVALVDQARIFQRFFRLERDINSPIRGSGLGLYISRRLIENMGGRIWVESKGIPGEGSTFHIQLPLAH